MLLKNNYLDYFLNKVSSLYRTFFIKSSRQLDEDDVFIVQASSFFAFFFDESRIVNHLFALIDKYVCD